MTSYLGAIVKLFSVDFVGSIVWFPVWWYTRGLRKVCRLAFAALCYRWKSYAFAIWAKNFFVPMYGAHDIWSRLISILMRSVVLLGRLIALCVEAILYAVGILLWIATLPAAIWLALSSFLANQ